MITAESITDEQIRELRRTPGLSMDDDESCRAALDRRLTDANRSRHRARCASILNARNEAK